MQNNFLLNVFGAHITVARCKCCLKVSGANKQKTRSVQNCESHTHTHTKSATIYYNVTSAECLLVDCKLNKNKSYDWPHKIFSALLWICGAQRLCRGAAYACNFTVVNLLIFVLQIMKSLWADYNSRWPGLCISQNSFFSASCCRFVSRYFFLFLHYSINIWRLMCKTIAMPKWTMNKF